MTRLYIERTNPFGYSCEVIRHEISDRVTLSRWSRAATPLLTSDRMATGMSTEARTCCAPPNASVLLLYPPPSFPHAQLWKICLVNVQLWRAGKQEFIYTVWVVDAANERCYHLAAKFHPKSCIRLGTHSMVRWKQFYLTWFIVAVDFTTWKMMVIIKTESLGPVDIFEPSYVISD